jgi:hypothetical protein
MVVVRFYLRGNRVDPRLIYAQASRQCDAKLDFTRVTINPRPGHSIAMGTVGSEDNLKTAPFFPLDFTLVAVDKQAYSINELFVYEMRLTNESGEAVWVPSSGQPIYRRGYQYPKGYRHILIEFEVQDAGGKNAVVSTYVLYGSADVAGSLRRLEPGHCIALRMPGYIQIYSNDQRHELLKKSVTEVTANANVYLFDPRDSVFHRYTRPRVSNKIPVKILGKVIPIVERKEQ